jgi:hypothetical protein
MRIRNVCVALALLALSTSPALGQGAPNRGGFTLLLNIGVGFQRDEFIGTTETGLGGLNLGIGGFVNPDMALWLRVSGTNVDYGGTRQVSGVGGPGIQYWVNDRVNLEGVVGVGFWDVEGINETGFGAMLGASVVLFNRGGHNFQLGVEYAPAFTDPETVHNIGIVFGWQLL